MSVLTRKRLFFTVVAALLVSTSLLADSPSPRAFSRMVYDPTSGLTILFGGQSAFDRGTQLTYETNETWVFNGTRWTQRYPATRPLARSQHGMVFDTLRNRVVMFGGRTVSSVNFAIFGDTWIYQNENWSELHPASAPSSRVAPAMAYDPIRDRIVLFGGSVFGTDGRTLQPIHDHWEFDGSVWQKISLTAPDVDKPTMVWDGARSQMVMLGIDDAFKTLMYTYDAATTTWNKVTPTAQAPCANEVTLTYQPHNQTILLVGGICSGTYDPAYTYDGTTWTKVEATAGIGYIYGHTVAYDTRRNVPVVYGGAEAISTPRAITYQYINGNWSVIDEDIRPDPRSQAAFVSDPVNKVIWMYGGLSQHESFYLGDFWRYQNGQWASIPLSDTAPKDCGAPYGALDTDRAKLIINCSGGVNYEMNLSDQVWTKFDPSTKPGPRRFASFEYDPVQKRTVLYGGFDGFNYLNDTWVWNGSSWTEIKNKRADARALTTMWFDPKLNKMVIYGGIGQPSRDDAVKRYNDMWQLESGTTGWTKMTITATPGERFGAKVLVDPRTNRVMLFGGIRVDQVTDKVRAQVFANDVWEWDGAWKKIETAQVPPGRENFMMAYDPFANNIAMFGGYAGFYYSDLWTSPDWLTWQVRQDSINNRRRAAR